VFRVHVDEDVRRNRLIARDGFYNPEAETHISETALDNHTFEYVIDNSGSVEASVEQIIDILQGRTALAA
jgi:dephospho-CoA kinase